jgi:hypothetical protein
MALNKIFQSTQALHRERPVPADTQPGTPLLSGARPAVTLTAAGGSTKTQTDGLPSGITSITYENGGASNLEDHATLAFDGTFEFAVTGATTSTLSDVAVYITSGGSLTLTASGNTLYGYTDYPRDYRKEAGRAPVKIGV